MNILRLALCVSCILGIDQPRFNSTRSVVLNEGTSLIISCFSIAYPISGFKWERNDGTIVSNSSYLSFTPVNRSDDNVYRCIGTNNAGTKKSSNLTITVHCKFFEFVLLPSVLFFLSCFGLLLFSFGF